jgi:hypothetical protein
LCREVSSCRGYSRPLALALLDFARGQGGASWEARRLAVCLLEAQVFALPRGDLDELDLWCLRLGLKECAGISQPLSERVLAEGYTTTELAGFGDQLRRRLRSSARLLRAQRSENGRRDRAASPSETRAARILAAWSDLIARARCEHRLPLARYVFSPAEVVQRIRGQLRLSRGLAAPFQEATGHAGHAAAEAAAALARLPPYEAEICRRLTRDSQIHWVDDDTPSALGGLLAAPPGTVVLVIRPPGSDLEIEIKRSGRRGEHPLGVVFERGGELVHFPHRLDGGSMLSSLQWEARMAAWAATVYRRVHAEEAPLSRTVAICSIYGVPRNDRSHGDAGAHVLDYFTEPAVFGRGYGEMRRAMRQVVDASRRPGDDSGPPELPGALGLSLQFLHHFAPGQALLVGTSSLRLDRIHLYLSAGGADAYFRRGLDAEPGDGDARHFADHLLEEVLGEYRPPPAPYLSHEQYVAAAFALPANRRRADRAFLSLARQVGKLWGTLVAVRCASRGESFVARNLGLRSLWRRGRREVAIVSMDHDALDADGIRAPAFHPLAVLPSLLEDERFVMGEHRPTAPYRVRGAIDYLGWIYRAGEDLAARGRHAVLLALARAYRRTRRQMRRDPRLAGMLRNSFVRELDDWDAVVAAFLTDPDGWRGSAERLLLRRGYAARPIAEHLRAVERHADFLTRYGFLYLGTDPAPAQAPRPGNRPSTGGTGASTLPSGGLSSIVATEPKHS